MKGTLRGVPAPFLESFVLERVFPWKRERLDRTKHGLDACASMGKPSPFVKVEQFSGFSFPRDSAKRLTSWGKPIELRGAPRRLGL